MFSLRLNISHNTGRFKEQGCPVSICFQKYIRSSDRWEGWSQPCSSPHLWMWPCYSHFWGAGKKGEKCWKSVDHFNKSELQTLARTKGFQVGQKLLRTGRTVARMWNAECKGNHQPWRDGEICSTHTRKTKNEKTECSTMATMAKQRSNIATVNIPFTCQSRYCAVISAPGSLRMRTLTFHNVPRTLKVLFTAVENVSLHSKNCLTLY